MVVIFRLFAFPLLVVLFLLTPIFRWLVIWHMKNAPLEK
jgi:hypothetical protein